MTKDLSPWHQHVSTFRKSDAQVTALTAGGELIVIAALRLVIREGREEMLGDDPSGGPGPSALRPFCRVTLDGAGEPLSWSGQEASIVVTGTHENGCQITIAGKGSLGWDDKGSLEFAFEPAPQMKVISVTRRVPANGRSARSRERATRSADQLPGG